MWFSIKVTYFFSLQILFRWLRFWALLQCSDEGKERILHACKLLESRAIEFFASYGWFFIYLEFSSEPVISLDGRFFLLEKSSKKTDFELCPVKCALSWHKKRGHNLIWANILERVPLTWPIRPKRET